MRISKLRVFNYRSIRDMTIECGRHVVLLGPNNHGKSNVLTALEFALTSSSKPDSSDFFRCADERPCELSVEVTFEDLTEQERTTFKKYVRRDGSFTVRKEATLGEGKVDFEYHGYLQDPVQWWLKSSSVDELAAKGKLTGLVPSIPELQVLLDKKGRVSKADVEKIQGEYIEGHYDEIEFEERLETGGFLGLKSVAAGVLPEFHLIPAVRDLSDETKIKAGSSLGRLVQRAVQEMAERDPTFAGAQRQLEKAVQSLSPPRGDPTRAETGIGQLEAQIATELADWDVSVFIEVEPPTVDRLFELGTALRLDDGVETAAEDKGHGLQRATLFALIRVWSRVLQSSASGKEIAPRKASESLVFAVEEPELFLHPQAQRQFQASLQALAESAGHQVFVVTHSSHFVDLDRYKDICIISRYDPAEGSRVRQCSVDLFEGSDAKSAKARFHMAAWVNPDRAEMMFARRVVLVEGETEKTMLPYLAERLGIADPSVSVIECGGKHNLPLYIELCKAFDLDFCVVHDEDAVPSDCPQVQLDSKKRTFALNTAIAEKCGDPTRVHVFCPEVEEACGITQNQAEKRGKGLAALNRLGELADDELPKSAVEAARLAYSSSGDTLQGKRVAQ